jgi:hypothetical protein
VLEAALATNKTVVAQNSLAPLVDLHQTLAIRHPTAPAQELLLDDAHIHALGGTVARGP